MSGKVKIDTSEFQRAMREYAKVSKADAATILNRFAVDVAFKAQGYTKSASVKGRFLNNKYNPDPGDTYDGSIYYAILSEAKKSKKGQGIRDYAIELYNRQRMKPGYHKAGWFNAIRDLGRDTRKKPIPGGSADKGYAKKATPYRLLANIYNYAKMYNPKTGHDQTNKNLQALQEAIDYVAAKRLKYARDRLAKTANKFSGRKR